MANKDATTIKKTAKKLLTVLGEKNFRLQVKEGQEKEWLVEIETDNPDPLIGYRGKALEALQLILKLMVSRKIEEWRPILVNVNDYRKKQKEQVLELVQETVQEAVAAEKAIALPPMSSYERRLVHLALKDDEQLETASEGEGDQRRVVIKFKTDSQSNDQKASNLH